MLLYLLKVNLCFPCCCSPVSIVNKIKSVSPRNASWDMLGRKAYIRRVRQLTDWRAAFVGRRIGRAEVIHVQPQETPLVCVSVQHFTKCRNPSTSRWATSLRNKVVGRVGRVWTLLSSLPHVFVMLVLFVPKKQQNTRHRPWTHTLTSVHLAGLNDDA